MGRTRLPARLFSLAKSKKNEGPKAHREQGYRLNCILLDRERSSIALSLPPAQTLCFRRVAKVVMKYREVRL